MADRYFVDEPIADATARLTGAEAHHLIHVMRARPGLDVVLFDGSGSEFAARVESVGRSDAMLAVLARNDVDRELPIRLTLGVALPKGDRQRWLVEKAVELGVARLAPLETRRGVAQASGETPARLRRAVIEASKQCGRNRLMEILPAAPLGAYLDSSAGAGMRWLAHPGGLPLAAALDARIPVESAAERLSENRLGEGDSPILLRGLRKIGTVPGGSRRGFEVALAVGPEGGFSDEEVAAALERGWQAIDLGSRILRIETAALLLVANLAARCDR